MRSMSDFPQLAFRYVTRLKENTLYNARQEYDIADNADSGILKDE